jgi:hypothetical protein
MQNLPKRKDQTENELLKLEKNYMLIGKKNLTQK